MEMGLELLIPGMQNGHKAQFAADVAFTKLQQGFRDGFKEDIEHEGFVAQDDSVQLMWQGKYYMEVGSGQQFGFSLFKPPLSGYLLALGAVSIPAGMIHDTLSATVIAAMKVAAKGSDQTYESLASKMNLYGSAISIGHPNTASGARIVMNLMYQLRQRGGGYALGALCGGLAQADACIIKVE